jgi:hypothetical protein
MQIQNTRAIICTLLSSSINKEYPLFYFLSFYAKPSTSMAGLDHGYAATTAAMRLLLLLSTHLSSPPCVEYAGRVRRKDQGKKTNEVCVGTASIRPKVIHIHHTATKRLLKNASPWDPLRAIL